MIQKFPLMYNTIIILDYATLKHNVIQYDYMAIITIEQLKSKFEGGDYPRSTDYINLIDTLYSIPDNAIIDGGTP
jgi:hypothetical protein